MKQLYQRYKRPDDRTVWKLLELQAAGNLKDASLEELWVLKYSQAIKIKMVAVWDTVGSLGVPFFSITGISRSTMGFLHTGLRTSIENGYHALAIDEHRKDFSPTLWTVRRGAGASTAASRPLSSVEQRWFVGAHANVGGGCESDLLAQVPLRWMMKKASLHGLTFRNDVELDGNVLTAAISDSYSDFMYGIYSKFVSRRYRSIGADPEQRNDGLHINVNETIDVSVFDRWRTDSTYRPPGIEEWAKRKGVSFDTLTHSVRADDPSTSAPD